MKHHSSRSAAWPVHLVVLVKESKLCSISGVRHRLSVCRLWSIFVGEGKGKKTSGPEDVGCVRADDPEGDCVYSVLLSWSFFGHFFSKRHTSPPPTDLQVPPVAHLTSLLGVLRTAARRPCSQITCSASSLLGCGHLLLHWQVWVRVMAEEGGWGSRGGWHRSSSGAPVALEGKAEVWFHGGRDHLANSHIRPWTPELRMASVKLLCISEAAPCTLPPGLCTVLCFFGK